MDIDSIADGLYSLPTAEFTANRNASEKEAKARGDRQLAAAIHRLNKPSAAAWLANQLVQAHRDDIEAFLDLGEALREATATLNGDQLRELGRQKHQLVAALLRQVKTLADAAGHNVSQSTAQSVEDTLNAALADEGAAEQLRSGRLTDTLRRTGFPSMETTPVIKPSPDLASPGTAQDGPDKHNEPDRQRPADRLNRAELNVRLAMSWAARKRRMPRSGPKPSPTAPRPRSMRQQRSSAQYKGTWTGLRLSCRAENRRIRKSQADLERADRAGREAARRLAEATARRAGDSPP